MSADAVGSAKRNEVLRRHGGTEDREAEAAVREAEAAEHDRRIAADVRASREAPGKPWAPEMETEMLARLAARRRRGYAG